MFAKSLAMVFSAVESLVSPVSGIKKRDVKIAELIWIQTVRDFGEKIVISPFKYFLNIA